MYIAMNRFKVAKASAGEFEKLWSERESYLHECDGFETCDTLRENAERCGYASLENIRSIRETGLDAWLASGQRRWFRPNR